MADMRLNEQIGDFFVEYGAAMQAGEPGPCTFDRSIGFDDRVTPHPSLPYHVLEHDVVEALRESSAAGGLAACERCGKLIFVPGYPDAGMIVRGLRDVNMQGVSI